MNILSDLKNKIERSIGHRNYLRQEYIELKHKLRKLEKKRKQVEEAQIIIQQIAKQTQEELQYSLSEIVYLAMSIVFDRPYSLNLSWVPKAGRTECVLRLEKNGKLYNPMLSSGGGMVNIAANSLRYAILNILRRTQNIRGILFLDEPFPGLKGEEANIKALEMVKRISKELNIQIILISDERTSKEIIMEHADKVFYVSQRKEDLAQIKILK